MEEGPSWSRNASEMGYVVVRSLEELASLSSDRKVDDLKVR